MWKTPLSLAIGLVVPVAGYAGTTITTPYAGIVRHSVSDASVNGRSVDYEVIVINTLDAGISFFLTPDNGALAYETTRQTTKNFASAYSTEVAINAHFFDTGLSPQTDNTGIAASNGTVYSPFETVGGLSALNITADNFPETVTGIYGNTTFASSPVAPYNAINPGSMLIRDGAVLNTGATDFRARSQIGVSRNGAEMMLFASSSGMTEQEGATILVQQFGAYQVHGLDGGGSTTLVLRTGASTQTIIARESAFSERAVGTNLGVQASAYVSGIPEVMSWDASPGVGGIQQGSGTWDVSTNHWQAAGVNRTWANPKTPILGAGGGAVITLGSRIAVREMTVDGGYTLGAPDGPSFTILGNFTTTGSQPTVILAPLGSSSSFTKLGNQTLTLGASARISMLTMAEGTLDLSGQTLTVIDPEVPLTLKGGVIQNGNLTLTDSAPDFAVPSGNTTISANLTLTKMTKSGAGAVYLGGANSWGTPLVVNEGTLGFLTPATVPSTAVSVVSGLLDFQGVSANITTLSLGGGSGGVVAVATGNGTLTLGGTLTCNAINSSSGATISGNLNLGATRTFTVQDTVAAPDDLTISANISGAYALTKNGNGTLVLSGNNSFSTFKNSAGVTRVGASEVLPSGTLTVEAGMVDLAGFEESVGAVTLGGVAAATPEIRTGAGVLNLGGTLTYSATGNGLGALITGNLNLGNATRTFTIGNSTNADSDFRVEAAIEGSAGMTKGGAGRMEIVGPLTLNGTLTVNNGELLFNGYSNQVGAVTLGGTANAMATLNTGNTTLSIVGNLSHSSSNNGLGGILRGRVDLGATPRSLVINNSTNAAVDMIIFAELAGSGGFIKSGTGTLELSGNNSLTGPVSCTAGVLAISHPQALASVASLSFNGTGSLDVTALPSGTLPIDRSNLTVSGVGSLVGNVSMSAGKFASPGSGNLTISGNLSLTGGTTEVKVGTGAGGILVSGNASLGGTLAVNVGGTLTANQTLPLITASAVTGSFSAFQLPTPPTGLYYVIETTATQVRLKVLSGTPSQSWLAAANLPTDTSLTSDPDSDGVPLLLEYALGGSAALTDEAPVSLVEGSEALQIQFLWNTQASDVTAIVEGSSDLLTWTTLLSKTGGGAWTGAASFTEGTPTGNLVPMTVTDPITTSPRYLRIRIIKP